MPLKVSLNLVVFCVVKRILPTTFNFVHVNNNWNLQCLPKFIFNSNKDNEFGPLPMVISRSEFL